MQLHDSNKVYFGCLEAIILSEDKDFLEIQVFNNIIKVSREEFEKQFIPITILEEDNGKAIFKYSNRETTEVYPHGSESIFHGVYLADNYFGGSTNKYDAWLATEHGVSDEDKLKQLAKKETLRSLASFINKVKNWATKGLNNK